MRNYSNGEAPSGEVYGANALNLAVIAASAMIMLGVLWQPAPMQATAYKVAPAQIEQVVVTAHHVHAVAG